MITLYKTILAPLATAAVSLLAPHPHALHVTPAQMSQWARVAQCEEHGNWRVRGAVYSGGLGITNVNWSEYSPRWFPRNASAATPLEQVFVALRINRGHPAPDQNGRCEQW